MRECGNGMEYILNSMEYKNNLCMGMTYEPYDFEIHEFNPFFSFPFGSTQMPSFFSLLAFQFEIFRLCGDCDR